MLAEDDDTYSPAAKPATAQPGTCPAWANSSKPERILLVGWRRDLDDLIVAVDEFVTPGSEVHLYNDVAVEEREKMLLHGGLNVDSLQVEHACCSMPLWCAGCDAVAVLWQAALVHWALESSISPSITGCCASSFCCNPTRNHLQVCPSDMLVRAVQNLTLVYKERMMQGEVVDRKRLEDLRPEQYTSILILSDADNLGTVDSDSRCIAGRLQGRLKLLI